MANTDLSTNQQPPFTDVLKNINFEDPNKLAEKETGRKIGKRIFDSQMGAGAGDSFNFFSGMEAHLRELELWSLGKQNMAQFLPYMNIVDANKSHAKIDLTPIMIGAQFVNTKVESIAKNEEYPVVKAIDDNSVKEKEDRMWDAFFRMKESETVNTMQIEAGFQLESPDAYVPSDEIAARVYFKLEDRLPKEIRFQELLRETLISNDYQRVLKPALLRDCIVRGKECAKVEKESDLKYSIRRCKSIFYNYISSDSGKLELRYIGEPYKLKIIDARKKFGKTDSNPNGLSESDLYEFAKKSTQSPLSQTPLSFNHQFSEQYNTFSGVTPWDDYGCFVIDFEIKVFEPEYYVSKTDNYGKENIAPKKGVPKTTSEKSVIQKKEKERWYRGVYAPYADIMIYWGKPDITILDYNNTEKSLCSYSINIPNNNGEYVPSLFERALEPLKEYALTKLKRKLLLSKLSPAAYKVDVHSARNITTGTGKTMEWEEIVQVKDTTGVELWSSQGLDPLTAASPAFSAATQDPTLQNIVQLSELLRNIEAEIRQLLGVPIYLDGSNVGERTAAKLAQGQTEGSFNVTGFISNAHNQLMEETLHKICILSWQEIVTNKQESSNDLINTRFKTFVKMKITDDEKQKLEDDIQRYSQIPDATGNPSITPKDARMLREIDDYELASWYLTAMYEENRRKAQKAKDDAIKINGEEQRKSLEVDAKNKEEERKSEQKAKKEILLFESTQAKELAFLNGYMQIVSKGVSMPAEFSEVVKQLIPNLAIPLSAENKMLNQVHEQQDQAIQQQQMQGQEMQEHPQQEQQEQPQEQMQQEVSEQQM